MGKKIKTKIVGVTYKNEDGTPRQELLSELSDGDRLRLVDVTSERFPEAIAVCNEAGEQLGHLSKSLALELRDMPEDFETFTATVLSVTGGDGKSYGCNIEIDTDDFFQCLITIGLRGNVSFKTPLVHTPAGIDPAVTGKVTLAQSEDGVAVYSEDHALLGYLPPQADEQIDKRHLDIGSCDGSIHDSLVDSDGDLHIRVTIDLHAIQAKPEPAAPVQPQRQTVSTPSPAPSENRFADLGASAPHNQQSTDPNEDKKSRAILAIIVISVALLLLYWFAPSAFDFLR